MRATARRTALSAALSGRATRMPCVGIMQTRPFSELITRVDSLETSLSPDFAGKRAVAGVTATVFGSSGMIGASVVNRLARTGAQIVLPYRGDGMNMRHLKVMGDLGQVVLLPMDLADVDSIRHAVKRSDLIINLIGNSHQTVNYSFHDTHVKCLHRIAKICKEAGTVKKFIHVSALKADLNSPSEFLKSKAEGEQVVREFFPNATIMRPAPTFGPDDHFLNSYADLINFFPLVPLINNGEQTLQPIHYQDVAQAIVNATVNSDAPGSTYELGGPDILTRKQLVDFIADDIIRPDTLSLPLPENIAKLYARAIEKFLPVAWRALSPDMLDQMGLDLTVSKDKGTLTCADLQVNPVSLYSEANFTLIRHRGNRDKTNNQFEVPKGLMGRQADY